MLNSLIPVIYRLAFITVLLSVPNIRSHRIQLFKSAFHATSGKVAVTTVTRSVGIVAPFREYHNFSLPEHGFRSVPRARFNIGLSAIELQNYTAQNPYMHLNVSTAVPFAGWFHSRQYAAAWLSSIDTFMKNGNFWYLDSKANLEYGTFAATLWRPARVFKSLDYFEFYVHHLSNWPKRFDRMLQKSGAFKYFYRKQLGDMESKYVELGYNNPNGDRNGKVLVIMPFHSPGDRHSQQDDKYSFLNLTVKAVSNVFPNIVVSVCNRHDYDYVTQHSGLNQFLYDVMFVELEESTHLPHASSVEARRLIKDKAYVGFDWIYFTEADQPPHLRDVNWLLHLAQHENVIVNPHRGHPDGMPGDLANFSEFAPEDEKLKMREQFKPLQSRTIHSVPDIRTKSCCFNNLHLKRPEELDKDENEMVYIYTYRGPGEVEWYRQHNSFAHVLGICNEFHSFCSTCSLTEGRKLCQRP